MFIPKDMDVQISEVKARLFPDSWLNSPDAEGNFPTNGDRFAAQEINKRRDTQGFTRKGFMLQAIAAGWHHKSAKQLKEMADSVGRERIQVIHGTSDKMITVPHAETLVNELGGEEGGITRIILENSGHALPMERRKDLKALIIKHIEKTKSLS
jgi:hypothetical protein